METEYITVDLEIRKKGKFPHLAKAFEKWDTYVQVHKIGNSIYTTNLSAPKSYKNPNKCIQKFLDFIEKLSPKAKKEWKSSYHKVFNIGYRSGETPFGYQSNLTQETLSRVSKTATGITITIYKAENV